MSQDNSFKESTSKRHLFIGLLTLVAMPLLPMVMGWYTYAS
ncbi:MAG: hypothetical protein P8H39_11555 [Thalassotalea sp.]|nr:hypothetical protein [Thalassotalea sp.]